MARCKAVSRCFIAERHIVGRLVQRPYRHIWSGRFYPPISAHMRYLGSADRPPILPVMRYLFGPIILCVACFTCLFPFRSLFLLDGVDHS